jgi:hypothetical protein
MESHPLNQYIFIIQQLEHDRGLNAYNVFRRILAPHVEVVKQECATFSYLLHGETRRQPFCYDILSSHR